MTARDRILLTRFLLPLFLTVCVFVGDLYAQPRIRGNKTYEVFQKIVLTAEGKFTDKTQFLWDIDGECDYQEAQGTVYVWAKPGKYKVKLTAVDFEAQKIERSSFQFEVTGKAPGPGPGPDPSPTPETALEKDLRVAYEADPDPDKTKNVKLLGQFYGEAAKLDMKDLKTVGELNTVMRNAAAKILPTGCCKKVQEVIQENIKDVLPGNTPETTINQDHKAALLNLFSKVAKGLERIKT